MENEKDIFDLLREESENLSEAPPSDAWQRLEKKLTKTRKIKRKRRPMELQLIGVVVAAFFVELLKGALLIVVVSALLPARLLPTWYTPPGSSLEFVVLAAERRLL